MKPLIVILAICTLGYVANHWQELTEPHTLVAAANAHELIIYGAKSSPPCVRLEGILNKRGVSYQKRDLSDEATSRELTDKLARVGKMGGSIAIPVAEIDGVLVENASIEEINRRMK